MNNSQTALYRHFDSEGRLLYVGISRDALTRAAQHLGKSKWRSEIASMTIERFPTRSQAELAEKAAIRAERPLWNIIHNRAASVRPSLVRQPKPAPRRGATTPTEVDDWITELGSVIRSATEILRCLEGLSADIERCHRDETEYISGRLLRPLYVINDLGPKLISLATPDGGVDFGNGTALSLACTALLLGYDWHVMRNGSWRLLYVDGDLLRKRLSQFRISDPRHLNMLEPAVADYIEFFERYPMKRTPKPEAA